MYHNFILVKVETNYCEYLRKFDRRVAYNKDKKELRPFVGVLFKIGSYEYFAPLTSPKDKHKKMRNTIDFLKLDKGKLGAINFNNMIPVMHNNYALLDLDIIPKNPKDKKYQQLLIDQLTWLNNNKIEVSKKAKNLYNLYAQDRLFANIKNRCCNFALLEEKCKLYQKEFVRM